MIENEQNQVTPLAKMKAASQGTLVTLSGFAPDYEPITVRLRKPNILALVKAGKIKNELLGILMDANESKTVNEKAIARDPEAIQAGLQLQEVFCQSCLVEPTYQELKDNGIELTDEQVAEIAMFAQGGVQALKSFRGQSRGTEAGGNSPDVSDAA